MGTGWPKLMKVKPLIEEGVEERNGEHSGFGIQVDAARFLGEGRGEDLELGG